MMDCSHLGVRLFLCLLVTSSVRSQVRDIRCHSNFGNFPDPNDCTQYVSCWGGRGFTQRCGTSQVFRPETRRCVLGMNCPDSTITPNPGVRIRLQPGSSLGVWAGRVEVWAGNGRWAGVKADDWTPVHSELLCTHLGFPGAESTWRTSNRGGGGVVEMECANPLTSILQCAHPPCATCTSQTQLASVRCRRSSPHRCPEVDRGRWSRWNGSCYLVQSTPQTPTAASTNCLTYGASLVSIASKDEHHYLSHLLSSSANQEYYTSGRKTPGGANSWVWGGGGGEITYSHFWPGWNNTPPIQDGGCLVLKRSYLAGKFEMDSGYYFFSRTDCDSRRPYVCKAPLSAPDTGSERLSTLLRPLSLPTTSTTTTTTTTPPTTLAKVRCSHNQYTCNYENTCLDLTQVCDGDRQCDRGDDEEGCKRFLQGYEKHAGRNLLVQTVLRTLPRADVGVCAKLCINDRSCLGFVFTETTKRCVLTSNDVYSTGLTPSSTSDFYESISRRRTCVDTDTHLKCGNGKCVSTEMVCDGFDECLDGTDESECYTGQKSEVRLVGGRSASEGNVQVRVDGEWRYICDDDFRYEEADVVCRSLGYSSSESFTRNNEFGRNDAAQRRTQPSYWLDKLSCTGRETHILACASSGLGVHDCGPTEIAGVRCQSSSSSCPPNHFRCGRPRDRKCIPRGQVCDGVPHCPDSSDESDKLCSDVGVTRLVDSRHRAIGAAVGTVFVKFGGRWGTVCDDGFNDDHAKVVCRSLGYEGGWAISYPRAFFGRGSGDVLLDEPGCRGGEEWLGGCSRVVWGVSDCDHSEDVGVLCSDQVQVRLSNGPTANSGRAELLISGVWGSVCDDDFDDYDAKVVCGMLGYAGDAVFHRGGRYGKGSGPVWLDALDCTGHETDLLSCRRPRPLETDCTHGEDVGVTCYTVKRGVVSRGLSTNLPGSCGRPYSSTTHLLDNLAKIVGGSVLPQSQHPWLVSLQLRENGRVKHNCGGVVISEDYLLSAAHCFKVHGKDDYLVRVGDYSMASPDSAEQDYVIEKLFVHPEFDTTVEFNNDLAVLKITRKNGYGIKLGKSIQAACLPPEEASYTGLKECNIVGWGTTSERAPPVPQDLPRSAEVNIYKTRECIGPGRYDAHQVTSGMVCAGDLAGKADTCTGDSGGPLICTHEGKRTLYGITSWGKGCGRKNQPGMYTKITKFLRWILEVVQK